MALVFCRECGYKHSDKAIACPKCGYRAEQNSTQYKNKSTIVYVLLAFLLGILGIHKFYAGKPTQGITLLLMGTIGWLLIVPGLIASIWVLVDFIVGLININNPEKIFK